MERTCGSCGVSVLGYERRGELRGAGCEGAPRDSRRDPCGRRALSDLGIDREIGDAVMELRLPGGVRPQQQHLRCC